MNNKNPTIADIDFESKLKEWHDKGDSFAPWDGPDEIKAPASKSLIKTTEWRAGMRSAWNVPVKKQRWEHPAAQLPHRERDAFFSFQELSRKKRPLTAKQESYYKYLIKKVEKIGLDKACKDGQPVKILADHEIPESLKNQGCNRPEQGSEGPTQ